MRLTDKSNSVSLLSFDIAFMLSIQLSCKISFFNFNNFFNGYKLEIWFLLRSKFTNSCKNFKHKMSYILQFIIDKSVKLDSQDNKGDSIKSILLKTNTLSEITFEILAKSTQSMFLNSIYYNFFIQLKSHIMSQLKSLDFESKEEQIKIFSSKDSVFI
ncbi:Hypothetical_protein [Hexamita inflata]|uniref:Hypothetical_protein n=1 Tax=Hexamita inflata TaxID=28002 RepID=A0AA86NQ72_9EUKA|nr:Hypothetical protein HINF_LOCUS11428 [Hexamita inflata]